MILPSMTKKMGPDNLTNLVKEARSGKDKSGTGGGSVGKDGNVVVAVTVV